MIHLDEDMLICDFAETYHVLDLRGLSPKMAAILAVGLPDTSRIKMKIANRRLTLEQMLMTAVLDRTNMLLWSKTKDAQRGANRPKSLLEALESQPIEKDYKVFNSIEEFERKRSELIRG